MTVCSLSSKWTSSTVRRCCRGRIGPSAQLRGQALPILREPQLHGRGRRLGAAAHGELAEDRADVMVDRALGEEELAGNLGIAQAARHEPQYLDLTRRQPCRVLARRGPRPAW